MVLFPGLVLPLHIFEERYRALVRDLIARPEDGPHEFGVVTLRRGTEALTTDDDVDDKPTEPTPGQLDDLYPVGCTAELRQVSELPDGCFDIMTVGKRRFSLRSVELGAEPYLSAEVDWLPDEEPDPIAERLAVRALAAFRTYLDLLRPDAEALDTVPADPTVLSHLIAATAQLTTDERHLLLAAPDTVTRLRTELKLLNREAGLFARVRAVPVPLSDLARPASPN